MVERSELFSILRPNLKGGWTPALIKEVRGKGLMVGAEVTRPGREVVDRCMKQGAIINCTAGNVLRFVPPLNINEGHVDEVVAVLDSVLEKWQ